jgi:hypothetical protein
MEHQMTPASTARLALALALVAGGTIAATVSVSAAGASTGLGTGKQTASAFGGSAFGSAGHLGTVFESGKSAYSAMCTSNLGVTHQDTTHNSSNPQVGKIGNVRTTVSSVGSGESIASVSKATTSASSLLGALVTGKLFVASARSATAPSGTSLTGGTTLSDVRIAGQAAPQHPAVNQTMALPGIGSVLFNHQTRSHAYGTQQITVTAMTINLTGNNTLGLPSGRLVISRAMASLHLPTHHQASGNAYGTTIVSGDVVRSGKTAAVYMPCGGSNGVTRHNDTGATSSQALRGGVTQTSARSTDSNGGTAAILTSKITGANLLGGVIKADAIVARAKATRAGSTLTRSSSGTSIGDLTINGQKQSGNQPANTKFAVPGIGTLWINRVVQAPNGLQVYALQLVLSTAQSGLSKGTVITLGAAKALVKK